MRESMLVWALVAGCGKDKGDEGDGQQESGTSAPSTMECAGASDPCEVASDFCIESWQGDVSMAGTCAPKDGCSDCDCVLERDIELIWQTEAGATDNCSGATLFCEQQDSGIRVICQK